MFASISCSVSYVGNGKLLLVATDFELDKPHCLFSGYVIARKILHYLRMCI